MSRSAKKGPYVDEKLYKKVTSDVKVNDSDIKKYYDENASTQYTTLASRKVRHILVSSKAKADALEAQLKQGADFAKLAKKNSTDTLSDPYPSAAERHVMPALSARQQHVSALPMASNRRPT